MLLGKIRTMRVSNGDLLHIINLDQEHHFLTRPTSASCVLFEAHESMQLGSRRMVCPLRAKQASQPATSSVPAHLRSLSGLHRAAPCSSVQQSCRWMNDLLFLFTFLVSLFSPTRSCPLVWRTAEPCGSPAAAINPALRLSLSGLS